MVRKAPQGADGGRLTTRFEALAGREERLAEVAAMSGLGDPAAAEALLQAAAAAAGEER